MNKEVQGTCVQWKPHQREGTCTKFGVGGKLIKSLIGLIDQFTRRVDSPSRLTNLASHGAQLVN